MNNITLETLEKELTAMFFTIATTQMFGPKSKQYTIDTVKSIVKNLETLVDERIQVVLGEERKELGEATVPEKLVKTRDKSK